MDRSQQKEALLQSLQEIALDPHSPDSERQKARRALERLADDSTLIRLLNQALVSESSEIVSSVLDLIGTRRGLPSIEPVLLGFLYDSSPAIRQKALYILGERGSPRVAPYLEEIIEIAGRSDSIFTADDREAAVQARRKILARSA